VSLGNRQLIKALILNFLKLLNSNPQGFNNLVAVHSYVNPVESFSSTFLTSFFMNDPLCGYENVIKNGLNHSEKQKFKGKDCL